MADPPLPRLQSLTRSLFKWRFSELLESPEGLNPGSPSHWVRELKHAPPFLLPLLLHPQNGFHISDDLAWGVKLVGTGKASVWYRVLHQIVPGTSLYWVTRGEGGKLPPLSGTPPPPRSLSSVLQVVMGVKVLASGTEAPSTAPLPCIAHRGWSVSIWGRSSQHGPLTLCSPFLR